MAADRGTGSGCVTIGADWHPLLDGSGWDGGGLMTLDDGAAARLAQIERRLAREEPDLADALHRWRSPGQRRPPRWSWRIAVLGHALGVLALLLGSVAWFVLLMLVTGSGWCLARGLERESYPDRG